MKIKFVILAGSVTLAQEDDRFPSKWRVFETLEARKPEAATDSYESTLDLRRADEAFRCAVKHAREDVLALVRVRSVETFDGVPPNPEEWTNANGSYHEATVLAWFGVLPNPGIPACECLPIELHSMALDAQPEQE